MGNKIGPVYVSPVAKSTPYDDTLVAPLTGNDDVQGIIDYLKNQIAISASPGFTWSRSGTIPASSWLQNDTVPSNLSGRTIFLNNAQVLKVYIANQDATSGIILGIYEHDGDENNMSLIGTVTTAATRSNTFNVSWSVTYNKQLAIKLETTSASAKNIVVGILMRGDAT